MIQPSSFSFPTPIQYGPGILTELGSVLDRLNISKPLVICDRFLPETDAFARFRQAIDKASGIDSFEVFKDVHPNPIEADVKGAVEVYHEGSCDGIIGLGGGSALDVAKVCRLNIQRPDFRLEDSEGLFAESWDKLPPFVAIPTTSGTGSEIGRSSVITLDHTKAKSVIFHPKLLADQVILDPEVTLSLPPHLTAATGLDALTHCIESYTSPVLQPLCDGIALEGIHLIAKHLVTAVNDGTQIESRGGMQLAALMGGIAFQKDLGSTHSMAHPLSNLCHLHHGLANALCLPAVMQWNAERKPGLYRRVAVAAGLDAVKIGDQAADQLALHWVEELIRETGIQMGLSNHGVEASHVEPLSDLAIKDSCHQTNPVPMQREDFVKLYQSAL